MKKHLVAAFLVIMLIFSHADAKSTFGQKVKQAAKKAYNKMKEIADKSEYGCPMVSSFCKQHCERMGKAGECSFLNCECS
uniref:Beta-KTx-like peptide n=1 Tax=Pandinus cavimanus TaxID=217261 RepID=H2CYQ1_PANCV|nr:beta-KTx-like peptide [Pandinus cavimanus]